MLNQAINLHVNRIKSKKTKKKTRMKKHRTKREQYNACGEHSMIKTMIVSNIKSEKKRTRYGERISELRERENEMMSETDEEIQVNFSKHKAKQKKSKQL